MCRVVLKKNYTKKVTYFIAPEHNLEKFETTAALDWWFVVLKTLTARRFINFRSR
jgi:hypothetical protein